MHSLSLAFRLSTAETAVVAQQAQLAKPQQAALISSAAAAILAVTAQPRPQPSALGSSPAAPMGPDIPPSPVATASPGWHGASTSAGPPLTSRCAAPSRTCSTAQVANLPPCIATPCLWLLFRWHSDAQSSLHNVAQDHQAVFVASGVLRGLAIATCCHHACTWQHYVNQPFFKRLGFSPEQFELISWMTGKCRHLPGGRINVESAVQGRHGSCTICMLECMFGSCTADAYTGWALCGHEAPPGTSNELQDADSPCTSSVEGEGTHSPSWP